MDAQAAGHDGAPPEAADHGAGHTSGHGAGQTADDAGSTPLKAASRRRADLHAGLVAVEQALASPAPGRTHEWVEGVRAKLLVLQEAFERHIDTTSGEGGLFADVIRVSPRLAGAVTRLDQEHAAITSAIGEEVQRLLDPACVDDAADTRERLLDLLGRLARHRQRGADLVYEAYAVDIGGG
jgi:hypothetical protein